MKYLGFCVWLLFALSTNATIVKIDDLSAMVRKSDVVAHIVIRDQKSVTDEDSRPVLLSYAEVIEDIKGTKTGDILTIYQLSLPNISGQSHFNINEEIVFFGMKYKDMVVSYGMGLGKFLVLREKNNSKVVEDIHDVILFTNSTNKKMYETPIPRRYSKLSSFLQSLKEALNTPFILVPTGPKAIRKKHD